MKNSPTLRYILIASLVLILVTLGGWYFFLRAKQAEIETADAGRGAGLQAQSFGGVLGSTYENIVSSLSSAFTGERTNERGARAVRLAQISQTPVAGAGFVEIDGVLRLRFVERGTGYVFDTEPETLASKRLTNTLVPHTYEALVAQDGRMVIRTADEHDMVVTIAARIATGTPLEDGLLPLVKTLLPHGITAVAVRPLGEEIFYIAEGSRGGVGIRAKWNGNEPAQIFSSVLTGWRVHWLPSDDIVIVQRPSDGASSYAYKVGSNGILSPLVRNISSLTILPHPTSTALLYGQSAGGLSLFARISGTSSAALLPIRTTADKCVWNTREQLVAYCAVPQIQPPPNFLDRRHRGEVHSADSWWRVDVRNVSAELLLSPTNSMLDVEDPIIDTAGNYISFTNAIDKSLWLLRLKE